MTPEILLIDNQGLSHYTCYLAKGLSKYKNIMLIGFSEKDCTHTETIPNEKVKISYITQAVKQNSSLFNKIVTRPFNILRFLFRYIVFNNYKIIHIQGHLPLFFLYLPFIKIKKIKLVWTIHDVELRPSSPGLRGKLETAYVGLITQTRILMKASDKIIVHGKTLKRQLITKGVKERKIEYMHHFDYLYLKKYIINSTLINNKDYLLFFGNIKPYKGLDLFLKSLELVEKQVDHDRINVLIAGKGNLDPYQTLLKGNKLKYVKIRNDNIPEEEIPAIFSKALVVVLPYHEASQSGIIPLAYTFSKPVIVSDVGALMDSVEAGKTGFIFKKGDIGELANYIINFVNNPELSQEMGKNAFKKLSHDMSLEYCSGLINSIYEELLL
ncbi:hypothetical protein BH23THE1_BH23THE1_31390 [soil metagenome]